MSGITTIKRTGYLHGGVTHPDGRRGFFKGAQADASVGKGSMSPGTSGQEVVHNQLGMEEIKETQVIN